MGRKKRVLRGMVAQSGHVAGRESRQQWSSFFLWFITHPPEHQSMKRINTNDVFCVNYQENPFNKL